MPHLFSPRGSTFLASGLLVLFWAPTLRAQGAGGLDAPFEETDANADVAMEAGPFEEETNTADVETGDAPSRVVHVEIMGGTTAPFDVSLGARLVLLERILLGASIGRSVYGGLAGSIAGSFGGDEVATVVGPMFSDAWMFRLGLGVRPFGLKGPELTVGYARWSSSADWSAADLSLPASVGSLEADVGLDLLFIELGWSIDVYGPVFLRPGIGFTRVLGASVDLRAESALAGQAASALESASVVAEDTIENYGRTPTLSLAVGARF